LRSAQASGIQLYLVVLLTGLAGYTWKAGHRFAAEGWPCSPPVVAASGWCS
jgi:hypothetical protein